MKSTKIMLAVIACLLTTWTSLSFIGWSLSDLSFKECYTDFSTIGFMIIFGWVPAIVIAYDL
jgi:hypothetical protein